MKGKRTRATFARGRFRAGRGSTPSSPARFWLLSSLVLLAGLIGGCAVLIAGAPQLAGEFVLWLGLVAGLALVWREDRQWRRWASERRCRVCGCTDERACVEMDLLGDCIPCHWVEPDLCSTCADERCYDYGNPFIVGGEPCQCQRCDGEGTVLVCVDDLCHAQGVCMHGDGEALCPECQGTGEA